jgi:thiol:disulfide interchange protein
LAVEQATRDGKRIILVVGGEWCIWCKILQDFLILNRDVKQQWDDNYITIKVYFGPENQNQPFLSQFPEINGYPHLFVLDSDGSLLHSQRTAELESRESYSKKKVTKFLDSWRPGS